jgi:hypothetical protein
MDLLADGADTSLARYVARDSRIRDLPDVAARRRKYVRPVLPPIPQPEAGVFTLNAPELGRVMVNERILRAAHRHSDLERAHHIQRERVRASLILRPEADAGWRRGS